MPLLQRSLRLCHGRVVGIYLFELFDRRPQTLFVPIFAVSERQVLQCDLVIWVNGKRRFIFLDSTIYVTRLTQEKGQAKVGADVDVFWVFFKGLQVPFFGLLV